MATATFPTAEKVVYYKIDKKLFEKIGQRYAIERPDAIRAVFGDSICWFVPTGIVNEPIDKIVGSA